MQTDVSLVAERQAAIDTFRRARGEEPCTLKVSPHLLADVLSCGTLAWVRHAEGYCGKGESIKLVAGSSVHAGIAAHLDGKPLAEAVEEYRKLYEPAFAALTADELPDQAYLPANMERLVSRWIEKHPPVQVPWRKVLSVEEGLHTRTWEFGPVSVQLIVRPDAVVEDEFGRVRWMDTKTTGWRINDAGWRTALTLSLQAALYTDAMVQLYDERASLGGWFNAMELRQLPSDPKRICKTFDGGPGHGVPYAECGSEHAKAEFIECFCTPERIQAAVTDATFAVEKFLLLLAAEGPTMLDMAGTAHGECRFCSNAAWCQAGNRVPEALPSFLKHDPWVISEGRR